MFDAFFFSPNSNRGASLGSHSKPTFLCLGLFVFFSLYFFLFYLSKQTHVFVSSLCFFFFLVGLFFKGSAKASYAPSPPFLPLCSLLTCELFQWDIFEFSLISTWLLNLFSCCLYIILILLWFLKFHLYYILGPRDHPDIVDSFMQLQAQVCFWFLISFTLGFSLLLFSFLLVSPCPLLASSLSLFLSSLLCFSGWASRCPIVQTGQMNGTWEECLKTHQTPLILTVTSGCEQQAGGTRCVRGA